MAEFPRKAEILAALVAEAPLRMQVRGGCMLPTLSDGTWIEVQSQRVYWPGDVLVLLAWDGRVLVHRLLMVYPRRSGWRWLTAADAATRPDASVARSKIIGKAVGVRIPLPQRLKSSVYSQISR
jgi:SOS-response transcriptional repressor LexA